jgi:hypothetical protein
VPIECTVPNVELLAERMIIGNVIKLSNEMVTLEKAKSTGIEIYLYRNHICCLVSNSPVSHSLLRTNMNMAQILITYTHAYLGNKIVAN